MNNISPNTPYDELKEWLTPAEVAVYMQVHPWTVYEGIKSGKIPHRQFGSKKIYIPKSYFHPSVAQVTAKKPSPHVKTGKAGALAEALP